MSPKEAGAGPRPQTCASSRQSEAHEGGSERRLGQRSHHREAQSLLQNLWQPAACDGQAEEPTALSVPPFKGSLSLSASLPLYEPRSSVRSVGFRTTYVWRAGPFCDASLLWPLYHWPRGPLPSTTDCGARCNCPV